MPWRLRLNGSGDEGAEEEEDDVILESDAEEERASNHRANRSQPLPHRFKSNGAYNQSLPTLYIDCLTPISI